MECGRVREFRCYRSHGVRCELLCREGHSYHNQLFFDNSNELVQGFASCSLQFFHSLGARTLMVPGNLPLGCNKNQYGCLKWINEFFEYYNHKLQSELDKFRRLHPYVNIIYADYYNAALELYHDPTKFGFFTGLKICCGIGGPYNYNASATCGNPGAIACDDPSHCIGCDGLHLTEAAHRLMVEGCYTTLFSFGDSLTDTGNLYYISPPQSPDCLLPPYGQTHFHRPNGRCSDGRLILDFLGIPSYPLAFSTHFFHQNSFFVNVFREAESLRLPYVEPYLGFKNGAVNRRNIEQGVNFAVAGATALGRGFFEEKGFSVDVATNFSLGVQLDWFKDLLPSLCNSSSGCKKVVGSSLFIVGEIGGNDYGYPLSKTTAIEDLVTYIPQVISVITSAIRELIDLGAVTFMVPGMLPLGCNSAYLTRFATIDEEEYDHAGCLKWLNMFFAYHNELLQIELNQLRVLYPLANIIYADYFNAALQLYNSPEQFGFGGNVLKVCCGGGGPYNFNDTAKCGDTGVIVCDDPSQYVSWDGYHLTESAYRWITKGLLDGPYTIPKFNVPCFTGETIGDFNSYAVK
ncbi:GDSL esterase/lipase, partial [Mucuna pruriens]